MEALAVKSSEVRKHFSEFIDTTLHKRPQIVERNRDHIIALNVEHLAAALSGVSLTARVKEDEDNFIATLDEVDDLIGYGESKEEAVFSLANDLIEYAHDYLTESFVMYFNAPNRKGHLPYVLKVMMQNDVQDVLRFIRVEH